MAILTVASLSLFSFLFFRQLGPTAGRASVLLKTASHSFSHSLKKSLSLADTVAWDSFGIRRQPPANSSYSQACQGVAAQRTKLSAADWTVVGRAFETALVEGIFPYWYGTRWSFSGHTDSPGQGEIACGYFVSTTLLQAGLRLNRYKLAQQSPENEARSLGCGERVHEFSEESTAENLERMRQTFDDGLLFVGLDASHVGYLLKRKGELFFIHSSYFAPSQVTVEKASQSPVFCAYRRYFVVELSNNAALMKKWIGNTTVEVVSR